MSSDSLKTVDDLVNELNAKQTGNNEWRARCPIHGGNNKTAFSITKGDDGKILAHCFSGCSSHQVGDWLKEHKYLGGHGYAPDPNLPSSHGITPYQKYHGKTLKKVYRYPGGCSVGRYEETLENGTVEKITIPFFNDNGNAVGYPDGDGYRRPLYSHQAISALDTVYIVEGEKCVDACNFYKVNAISWPGGSKAVKKADWSSLKNKNIFIWPDNDETGKTAAKEIKDLLDAENNVSICNIPEGKASGWDVADYIEAVSYTHLTLPTTPYV